MSAALTAYGRNCEDVLLLRALGHVARGVYLDSAAGEPLRASATQALYERGWHGVNLAPAPARLRRLRIARPADVNLALAAAAAPGRRDWYELAGDDAAAVAFDAGFDAAHAERARAHGRAVVRHSVALQTLEALWDAHIDGPLHLLRVGGDAAAAAEALAGLDLQRRRPWIVLLRADGTAPVAALTAARYALAHADGHNQFYVADEHAALAAALALPPHPADQFVLCEDHPYSQPLDGWRRRVAAAEAEAAEARAWAQAHVREWRQKYEQVEAAEARAAEAARLADQAGRLAAEAGERAAAAQRYATDTEARANAADLRAALAERDAAVAAQRASEAEQQAALAAQQAAEAAVAAAQSAARALDAEAQLPALGARIVHEHARLTAMSTSVSWRVTAPLRGANMVVARTRAFARALPRRAAGAAKRRARGLAGRALRYVDARPRLSFFLRRNLARLPVVAPLLRRLKLRLQMGPAAPAPGPAAAHGEADAGAAAALEAAAALPPPSERDELPDAARRAFDDLRRAHRAHRS